MKAKKDINPKVSELEYLYSLIDMRVIKLNSLQNDIKISCRIKANQTRDKLSKWFVNTKIPDFKNVFSLLCPAIMEQPLYLLEALEKYPDYLKEPPQMIYIRKYFCGKLDFPKEKSFENKLRLKISIEELANNKDKDNLNSIFFLWSGL